MSFNWAGLGNTLSGIVTAVTSPTTGLTTTQQGSLLSQIGLALHPNEQEELALCGQILQYSYNPAFAGMEQQLEMKLATENGLPPSAVGLVMSLAQPGVDVPTRVLQIEAIIKAGG